MEKQPEVVLLPEVHAVGMRSSRSAVTAYANDGTYGDTRPDRADAGRTAVAALGLRDLALQQAGAEARVEGQARAGAAVQRSFLEKPFVSACGTRPCRSPCSPAGLAGVVAAPCLCGGCRQPAVAAMDTSLAC